MSREEQYCIVVNNLLSVLPVINRMTNNQITNKILNLLTEKI